MTAHWLTPWRAPGSFPGLRLPHLKQESSAEALPIQATWQEGGDRDTGPSTVPRLAHPVRHFRRGRDATSTPCRGKGSGGGPPPAWHGSSAQPEPPDNSGAGLGAGVSFAFLPRSPPSSSVTRNLGLTLERPRGRDLQSRTGRMDRQTDTDGRGEGRHRQAIKPFSPQRCQQIITRLVLRHGKPGRTPISPGCPTPPLLAGAPPLPMQSTTRPPPSLRAPTPGLLPSCSMNTC